MVFDRSEFLSTFTDEARDHLQKMNEGLLALEKDPDNSALLEEMFREGHTLKGAARMMGFDEIKDISHCIEDIFGAILNKNIHIDEELSTILFKSLDTIESILGDIINNQPISTNWKSILDLLKKAYEEYLNKPQKKTKKAAKKTTKKVPALKEEIPESAFKPEKEKDEIKEEPEEEELNFQDVKKELEEKGLLNLPFEEETESEESKQIEEAASSEDKINSEYEELKATTKSKDAVLDDNAEIEEYIKVSISKINKLLNLVGEMVINKINSNEKINSLRRLVKASRLSQKKLIEISGTIVNNPAFNNLHNFDELKLNFHELNNDLLKIKDQATVILDEVSIEVSQLDPIIDELQLRMKQVRMLPIGNLFETMPRLVRDIAVAQGKKVKLSISGEETELDKKVLEAIKSSFIHLLRNSVDHGIEVPEERLSAGKALEGNISLRAFHKGGNVVIEVEDDGRGMNVEKIKETALRRGLLSINDLSSITEQEILNFVFYPGFSTAPIITDISGRGIGLDVVKTDIEALKGNIAIDTHPGRGTIFSLQLPLTVAIIQALLVRVHNSIFAIPLLSVEESISISRKDISSIENRFAIQLRNKTISVVKLSEILKIPVPKQNGFQKNLNKESAIVILNSIDKLLGIEVDEIMGEQEVFIKSLDKNLGKLKNVSGATVLGSGEVIIILDVLDLFFSSKTVNFMPSSEVKPVIQEIQDVMPVGKPKRILIVEDSLTTRELEKSILQTHGYEVDTSIDGMDALIKLQNYSYDLIVSDVEMPKMDGFELCKAVKQNPDLKEVPFIVVSALDREEDKRRGIEAGAQAYIIKKTFDQSSLIDTIKRLIG
ncbi:MAG: hypothetical protein ACD_79C00504G0002 [uncultured bacterium]|nr:MAG: hypothetical protein ACD_79C00504G0002 [uncultured bacterium]